MKTHFKFITSYHLCHNTIYHLSLSHLIVMPFLGKTVILYDQSSFEKHVIFQQNSEFFMYGKLRSPHNLAKIKSPKVLSVSQINKMLKQNPYDLPSDDTLMQIRENSLLENKKQLKNRAQTRIEYRALGSLPALNEKNQSFTTKQDDGIKPVAPERQRKQQMSGFVEQTRDILLAQIKIDRKRKEIERINQLHKTEKGIIQQQIAKIAETNNQYEMTANSIRAEAARARSDMEQAIAQKSQLQKSLKTLQNSVSKIKAEITKNEDIVFSFRNYRDFLQSLTPPGEDPIRFFQRPEQLIQELEQVEEENLSLIQEIKEMEHSEQRALDSIRDHLNKATQEKNQMEAAASHIPKVDALEFDNSSILKTVNETDLELKKLTKIVSTAYSRCFANKTDLSPVMMLERIENGLEKLYQMSEEIPNSFLIEEQAAIDKDRREKQRIGKQKEKDREQKMKIAAALERANKPVKKRTGRPLNTRVLPIVHTRVKKDDKRAQDEKMQEELLFGPINY